MIKLTNISVQYKNGSNFLSALSDFNLEIGTEFLAIVGPSGCGKTTLLRVLAGLVLPTDGNIKIEVSDEFSYGIVFQDYSLLPWLNVRQNIELGLKMRNFRDSHISDISCKLLDQLDLASVQTLLPHQLSGGMRQRVAVGRAFAQSPALLLMDEPFGALDAITRQELQQILIVLYQTYPHTVVFVTHDVEEALLLSERLCVMSVRPGTVREIITVPFAYPRNYDITRSAEFLKLKHQIEDYLR